VLVAVVLGGILLFVGRHRVSELVGFTSDKITGSVPVEKDAPETRSYTVKTVELVSGDIFDVILEENNTRILAKLEVFTTRSAKEKVRVFLNESTNPRVVLKKRLENVEGSPMWAVDMYVTHQGQEIKVSEWLTQQNLVYK
jgi:hypothetical protein